MKKFSMMLLILALMALLTGCKRWHTKEIVAGIYESNNSVEFGDLTFEKIRIEIVEISKDEFNNASNMDVIEDLATPSTDRKYYAIKLNIKELGKDDFHYPITYMYGGAYIGTPNKYVFSFDFIFGNETNSVRVDIGVAQYSRLEVQMSAGTSHSFEQIALWMIDE